VVVLVLNCFSWTPSVTATEYKNINFKWLMISMGNKWVNQIIQHSS
jgi:hypothetical protein